MSCNGCRVLRKRCSETCILRPCLQWIQSPESQGHATVFVAKFFGRAGLMSFISAVPESQRTALFQSLLFEACGRTVNPVNGSVGLLWTGNWHLCQTAVETVLRGGMLRPIPELLNGSNFFNSDVVSEPEVTCTDMWNLPDQKISSLSKISPADQNPRPMPNFPVKRRLESPSMDSEESGTTTTNTNIRTCFRIGGGREHHRVHESETKLLNLFR